LKSLRFNASSRLCRWSRWSEECRASDGNDLVIRPVSSFGGRQRHRKNDKSVKEAAANPNEVKTSHTHVHLRCAQTYICPIYMQNAGNLGVKSLGRASCASRHLRDAAADERLWEILWEGPLPCGFAAGGKAAHAALWLLAKGEVEQVRRGRGRRRLMVSRFSAISSGAEARRMRRSTKRDTKHKPRTWVPKCADP